MPHFRVAHIREQGQDMIIVPVDGNFRFQPDNEQESFMRELQSRANSAGLRGTVAAVWSGGFRAPRPWHPFFQTLSMQGVLANLNREISW